ncbi:hypothetical protein CesoFtcFv8_023395 [Champsocephalus esox]|uniref:Uncharacterized protein n=1 Tax=Champsocephalus esox TaxID=159716 RepID=A0AAN8B8A7_9TELE|nr:hypothetical protein CesoFtcFv8_023395 [Champsocephalus esox]
MQFIRIILQKMGSAEGDTLANQKSICIPPRSARFTLLKCGSIETACRDFGRNLSVTDVLSVGLAGEGGEVFLWDEDVA